MVQLPQIFQMNVPKIFITYECMVQIHKPKLLILDKPNNGLDPMGIREMRDFFIELVKVHGMTLLISSHILTEIEHIPME